jgi:ATP-dependent DNA ligase
VSGLGVDGEWSELRKLPTGLVLDGELIAWKGQDPWFPRVCKRALNADLSVPVTYLVFDLLRLDGTDLTDRRFD